MAQFCTAAAESFSDVDFILHSPLPPVCSRMIVEMPYGANFGVEGAKSQEKGAIPMGDNQEDGVREHATMLHQPSHLATY